MPAHMGKECERMQAMRVQHARKGVQYERAHGVVQEKVRKDARAHGENEWKGPPPAEGEKKGGNRIRERRKEERN